MGWSIAFYTGSLTKGIGNNFYMLCCLDNVGFDTSATPGGSSPNDLDIRAYKFTMSSTRFYGKIKNATGTWLKKVATFLTGFRLYGYSIGINNPDRPNKTTYIP
jgi:hypothetical protein